MLIFSKKFFCQDFGFDLFQYLLMPFQGGFVIHGHENVLFFGSQKRFFEGKFINILFSYFRRLIFLSVKNAVHLELLIWLFSGFGGNGYFWLSFLQNLKINIRYYKLFLSTYYLINLLYRAFSSIQNWLEYILLWFLLS